MKALKVPAAALLASVMLAGCLYTTSSDRCIDPLSQNYDNHLHCPIDYRGNNDGGQPGGPSGGGGGGGGRGGVD